MPALKTRAKHTTNKMPGPNVRKPRAKTPHVHSKAGHRASRVGGVDRVAGRFFRFAGPFSIISSIFSQLSMYSVPFAELGGSKKIPRLIARPASFVARMMNLPADKFDSVTVEGVFNKLRMDKAKAKAKELTAAAKGKLPESISGKYDILEPLKKLADGAVSWLAGFHDKKSARKFQTAENLLGKIGGADLSTKGQKIVAEMKGMFGGNGEEFDLEGFLGKADKLKGALGDDRKAATMLGKVVKNTALGVDSGERASNKTFSEAAGSFIARNKKKTVLQAVEGVASAAYKVNQYYSVYSGLRGALHSLKMIYADVHNVDVGKLSWFGSAKLAFKAIFSPGKSTILRHARKNFFSAALPKVFTDFIPLIVMNLSGRFMKNATEGKKMAAAMVSNMATGGIVDFIHNRRDMLSAYQVVANIQAMGKIAEHKDYAALIDAAIPKGQARPENSIGWAAAYYAKNNTDVADVLADIENGMVKEVAAMAYNEVHAAQQNAAAIQEKSQGQQRPIVGEHTGRAVNNGTVSPLESILSGNYKTEGAVAQV